MFRIFRLFSIILVFLPKSSREFTLQYASHMTFDNSVGGGRWSLEAGLLHDPWAPQMAS